MSKNATYRKEKFRIEKEDDLHYVTDDEMKAHITPGQMQLLNLLIANENKLIHKDTICIHLFGKILAPGKEDSVLRQHIAKVKAALQRFHYVRFYKFNYFSKYYVFQFLEKGKSAILNLQDSPGYECTRIQGDYLYNPCWGVVINKRSNMIVKLSGRESELFGAYFERMNDKVAQADIIQGLDGGLAKRRVYAVIYNQLKRKITKLGLTFLTVNSNRYVVLCRESIIIKFNNGKQAE